MEEVIFSEGFFIQIEVVHLTAFLSPWQGLHFLLDQKTKQKTQDWVNVTLKAFGFTKQLQDVSLGGSVLNANPKVFLTYVDLGHPF